MIRNFCCVMVALVFSSLASAQPEMHVLTYNIWGLYKSISNHSSWRFGEIGRRLGEFDIVAVQEAWDKSTEDLISESNFPYVVRGPHAHKFPKDSGLVLLTRYPVLETEFMQFNKCAGFDCFTKKGVLRTRLSLPNGSSLDVYNTHMNAAISLAGQNIGYKIRKSQIQQFTKFLSARSAGVDYLILGDTNVPDDEKNYERMKRLFKVMDLFSLFTPDPPKTYVPGENTWVRPLPLPDVRAERIDYILLREGSLLKLKNIQRTFEETVWNAHLSDHFGIKATLSLP